MLKFPGYFYCLKTLVTGWLKERSLRSLKTIAQSSEIAGARYFSAEALPSNLSEKGDDHLQWHEDLEITIEREQPWSFITLKLILSCKFHALFHHQCNKYLMIWQFNTRERSSSSIKESCFPHIPFFGSYDFCKICQ